MKFSTALMGGATGLGLLAGLGSTAVKSQRLSFQSMGDDFHFNSVSLFQRAENLGNTFIARTPSQLAGRHGGELLSHAGRAEIIQAWDDLQAENRIGATLSIWGNTFDEVHTHEVPKLATKAIARDLHKQHPDWTFRSVEVIPTNPFVEGVNVAAVEGGTRMVMDYAVLLVETPEGEAVVFDPFGAGGNAMMSYDAWLDILPEDQRVNVREKTFYSLR